MSTVDDDNIRKTTQKDCGGLEPAGRCRYTFALPKEADPVLIGLRAAKRFDSKMAKADTHYKTACTWYGALKLASLLGENALLKSLSDRFGVYMNGSFDGTLAGFGHVDENVFGIVPFEIFMNTKDTKVLAAGRALADHQMKNRDHPDQKRFAVDDMFMLVALQVQAYRATGETKYLDFAASRMVEYLKRLQRDDGLFYHLSNNDIKWGRGNGWFASGMTEILQELDVNHECHEAIRTGYQRMMAGLVGYQIREGEAGAGLWRQVIDRECTGNWPESSGSAMFTYAMITGVDRGWLDSSTWGPVATRAWCALAKRVTEHGDLQEISDWCYFPTIGEYLCRGRLTGDGHGQAPLLWTASALIHNLQDNHFYDIAGGNS